MRYFFGRASSSSQRNAAQLVWLFIATTFKRVLWLPLQLELKDLQIKTALEMRRRRYLCMCCYLQFLDYSLLRVHGFGSVFSTQFSQDY